jgi:predicted RND superfamily exporter protein
MELMIIPKNSSWGFQNHIQVSDTITALFNVQQELSNVQSVSTTNHYLQSQIYPVRNGLLKYTAIKSGLYHNASNITKIGANLKDVGRLKTQLIRDKFRPTLNHLESRFNLNIVDVGDDYLFDKAHEYRINNMFQGLVISISFISGIMLLIYRNRKYLLMVVVANMLPLLLAAGFMGWTGIELRGATSILFTIGFAIAIDDTIHFISQFRRLKDISNMDLRLSKTLEKAGTPIMLSSITLGLGFLVLFFSQLWDLRMFGLLVAAFVVFAVFTDAFILPVLIYKWYKFR